MNVGAVATPLLFVVAVVAANPPVKVPLAPVDGAVNVTVTPLTALLLASLTVAASAVAKLVLTAALCGVPAVAVTLAGGPTEAFTVNVNVVVWDRDPVTPVTVIVDVPVGVDADVVSVNVDEQVGLHDPGENAAVAPVGRPAAENVTDCAVPETSVAVIVLEPDCP